MCVTYGICFVLQSLNISMPQNVTPGKTVKQSDLGRPDIVRQVYYGRYITADILRQIYDGRCIMADILRQIYHGRCITARISRQIYYGRYIMADILWTTKTARGRQIDRAAAHDRCIRIL